MDSITPGSQQIVKVLLDESDERPIWIQAWGGTNTIARALKTIEEEHPRRMEEVAKKLRFFFIWEQDSTYQPIFALIGENLISQQLFQTSLRQLLTAGKLFSLKKCLSISPEHG